MRPRYFLASAGAVVCSTALVLAQTAREDEPVRRNTNVPRSARAADRGSALRAQARMDAQVLALIDAKNDVAIHLGSLAAERASTEEVRSFANEIVREHSRLDAELHAAVAGAVVPSRSSRFETRSSSRSVESEEGYEMDFRPANESGLRQGGGLRTESPVARIEGAPAEERQSRARIRGEAAPVYGSRFGNPLSGQETGPTGTRARDVLQGETGGYAARGARNRPNTGVTLGPQPVVNLPPRTELPPVLEPIDSTDRGVKIVRDEPDVDSGRVRVRDEDLDRRGRGRSNPTDGDRPPALGETSPVSSNKEPTLTGDPSDFEVVREYSDAEEPVARQSSRRRNTPPLGIMHGVFEQQLADIEAELQQLEGVDFDRAYLSHQIFFHRDFITTMRAIAPQSSLNDTITAALANEQEHLDRARRLLADLPASSGTKRTPEPRPESTEDAPAKSERAESPASKSDANEQKSTPEVPDIE